MSFILNKISKSPNYIRFAASSLAMAGNRIVTPFNYKFSIFVTQPIPEEALKILEDNGIEAVINETMPLDRQKLLKCVGIADGLFCTLNENIDKELLDAGRKLKVIGTCSVGFDHIDLQECALRNIKVGYTPGVKNATAEFAIALILNLARCVTDGVNKAKEGKWSTWTIMGTCGKGLFDSVVGIFGLGHIGYAVAEHLKGFHVAKILYHDKHRNEEAEKLGCELVSFDELLSTSDCIVCTVVATEETYKIFNKDAFKKMKPDSIFVNVSRGQVVDQDDLYEALRCHKIKGAALDVTDPEPLPHTDKLFKLKNCLITPHMSSAETRTRLKMATITAENILNGLINKPLAFQVPFK